MKQRGIANGIEDIESAKAILWERHRMRRLGVVPVLGRVFGTVPGHPRSSDDLDSWRLTKPRIDGVG